MTAEQIIQDVRAIKYKGISFVARVERNNARNKELSFSLHKYGRMEPQEGGGIGRSCSVFLVIDAILDAVTGKIEWNYLDADMQGKAEQTIYDPHYRTTLHQQLVTIFGTDNHLSIKQETTINDPVNCGAEGDDQ